MDRETAIQILERVRDGCDPETGEVLDADHPYQRAELVRALYTVLDALRAPVRPRARNSGRPWTEDDERVVVEGFDEGTPVGELAARIGRSAVAVRARLIKLGKLDPADVVPSLRYAVVSPASSP